MTKKKRRESKFVTFAKMAHELAKKEYDMRHIRIPSAQRNTPNRNW